MTGVYSIVVLCRFFFFFKQKTAYEVRISDWSSVVCSSDLKKLKMLRRHLMTHYNMTPEDYRAKWNLPKDYPMVAPNYAEKRRALAKAIGLGTKGRGGGRTKATARGAK